MKLREMLDFLDLEEIISAKTGSKRIVAISNKPQKNGRNKILGVIERDQNGKLISTIPEDVYEKDFSKLYPMYESNRDFVFVTFMEGFPSIPNDLKNPKKYDIFIRPGMPEVPSVNIKLTNTDMSYITLKFKEKFDKVSKEVFDKVTEYCKNMDDDEIELKILTAYSNLNPKTFNAEDRDDFVNYLIRCVIMREVDYMTYPLKYYRD